MAFSYTEELRKLRAEISEGQLEQFARVGREDFEKLVSLHMANAMVAHLTFTGLYGHTNHSVSQSVNWCSPYILFCMIEYFYKSIITDNQLDASTSAARIQEKTLKLEYELLLQQVTNSCTIAQLAKYRHETEV